MKKKIAVLFILALIATNTLYSQVTFKPYQKINIGSDSQSAVSADLDNDGKDDLVIGVDIFPQTDISNKILVYFQGENGLSANPIILDCSLDLWIGARVIIDVGDLDNNGLKDVITTVADQLIIFYQVESRVFAKEIIIVGNDAHAVKTGDLNNDGLTDLVVTRYNKTSLKVYYQNNLGELEPTTYPTIKTGLITLEIADMNNDGLNDLVFCGAGGMDTGFFIYLQKEDGFLADPIEYPFYDWLTESMAVGYLNDDDKLDVVLTAGGNYPSAKIILVYQKPDTFEFDDPLVLQAYDIPDPVRVFDLDCDGNNEIIVGHDGWNKITIYDRSETGVFGSFVKLDCPTSSVNHYSIAIGDFDNDGRHDIVQSGGDDCWLMLTNNTLPDPDTISYNEFLGVDTAVYSQYYIEKIIDTVAPNVFIIIDSTRIDSIHIDQAWRNNLSRLYEGYVCDYYANDTVPFGEDYFHYYEDYFETYHSITYDTLYLAINEDSQNQISIYPNPSSGEFFIDGVPSGQYELQVINQLGKIVLISPLKVEKSLINMKNQPEGVYVIIITKKTKQLVLASKLILRKD